MSLALNNSRTNYFETKINILQKLFTSEAAPNSMVQMVYKANECQNGFIRTALETINEMNNIAFHQIKKFTNNSDLKKQDFLSEGTIS